VRVGRGGVCGQQLPFPVCEDDVGDVGQLRGGSPGESGVQQGAELAHELLADSAQQMGSTRGAQPGGEEVGGELVGELHLLVANCVGYEADGGALARPGHAERPDQLDGSRAEGDGRVGDQADQGDELRLGWVGAKLVGVPAQAQTVGGAQLPVKAGETGGEVVGQKRGSFGDRQGSVQGRKVPGEVTAVPLWLGAVGVAECGPAAEELGDGASRREVEGWP
jgi:hypothetical protein